LGDHDDPGALQHIAQHPPYERIVVRDYHAQGRARLQSVASVHLTAPSRCPEPLAATLDAFQPTWRRRPTDRLTGSAVVKRLSMARRRQLARLAGGLRAGRPDLVSGALGRIDPEHAMGPDRTH